VFMCQKCCHFVTFIFFLALCLLQLNASCNALTVSESNDEEEQCAHDQVYFLHPSLIVTTVTKYLQRV